MADRRVSVTSKSPGHEPRLDWPDGEASPLRAILMEAGGDPRGGESQERARADNWFPEGGPVLIEAGFPRLPRPPRINKELKRDALQVGASALEGGVDEALKAPPGERGEAFTEGALRAGAGASAAVGMRNGIPVTGPRTPTQDAIEDQATNALGGVLEKGIEAGSKRLHGLYDAPAPAAKTTAPTRADDTGLPDRRYWSEAEAQVRQFNDVSARIEALEKEARARGAYASGPQIEALRYTQMAIADSMKAAKLRRDQAAQAGLSGQRNTGPR